MAKKTVKIADLAQLTQAVDISDDQQIIVRALNLREMVTLFVEARDVFLPLYGAGLQGEVTVEQLAPFLMSSPGLVAKIIAIASDEPESAEHVEKHMAATVQLIALSEVWKLSVPDQKKASQLLSEVTKQLQKLSENVVNVTPPLSSPTTLQPQ